jgi:type IV pilus assembly protein PilV
MVALRLIEAMMKKSVSDQKGFTLIEVMIAIFLLVAALLGLASVTTSVIKGNSFSQTLTTATTLAKDKMEELKATAYISLPAGPVTDYASANGTVQTSATGSYYTRFWTAPGTNTKTITVTVIWPTNQTGQRTVELKTIRASD